MEHLPLALGIWGVGSLKNTVLVQVEDPVTEEAHFTAEAHHSTGEREWTFKIQKTGTHEPLILTLLTLAILLHYLRYICITVFLLQK